MPGIGRLRCEDRSEVEARRSNLTATKRSELSECAGLAISTLSKVENGQTSLTYDNIQKVANGFGICAGVTLGALTQAVAQ
jgi:transcriptional regulator with XRE-family HTH domain